MGDRTPPVLEAGLPKLSDRRPGEFIILRICRVGQASIDQVCEGNVAPIFGQRLQQFVIGIVVQRGRQFSHQTAQRKTETLQLLHLFGIEACLARILDVLGTLEYLIQIGR